MNLQFTERKKERRYVTSFLAIVHFSVVRGLAKTEALASTRLSIVYEKNIGKI